MSSDKIDPDINNTARSQPGELSGNDGHNLQPKLQREKLVKQWLLWRSRDLQLTIKSLDRKTSRQHTNRAMAICLDIVTRSDASRPVPKISPKWIIGLLS